MTELTGTWVAIGVFGAAESHGGEIALVECAGLMRESKTYEQAMLITGNSVEPRFIGAAEIVSRPLTADGRDALAFAISFGGDASPQYRCRFTAAGTLVCLIDAYDEGVEFRRMAVTTEQLCQPAADGGYCSAR